MFGENLYKRDIFSLRHFLFLMNLVLFSMTTFQAESVTISIKEVDYGYKMRWGYVPRTISTHWKDNGTREPVFVKKDNYIGMTITFKYNVPWPSYPSYVFFRATSPSGYTVTPPMQAISPGELQSTFTFSTNQLVSNFTNQIAVFQLTFDWEYSLDMGITWLSAGYTQNPCYVAFDYPKPPWGALPVYVEIMELACNGMWGATTAQAAVQQLTPGLHSYLMYDQFMHFSGISIPGDFYVRSFVCRCNGLSSGPAEGNDCRDFANIIKSLTAAIGIDFVNICAFNNNGGPFLTRPIKPAKLSPLNNGTNWSFHQINYEIWGAWWYMIDGSLLLDYDQIDANGWTSPGFLANYNIGWSDYTLRLSNFSLSSIGGWSTISLLEGVRPWNPTPP